MVNGRARGGWGGDWVKKCAATSTYALLELEIALPPAAYHRL